MGSRFSLYAASVELHSICNGYIDSNGKNWTFEGCFRGYPGYPGLQEYLKNGYCQLAQCFADGGSSKTCYCQLYHEACKAYGNERPYNVSTELIIAPPNIIKLMLEFFAFDIDTARLNWLLRD